MNSIYNFNRMLYLHEILQKYYFIDLCQILNRSNLELTKLYLTETWKMKFRGAVSLVNET